MRNPILKNFYAELTAQEEKVQQILQCDNLGWMLKAAISELDWYRYHYIHAKEISSDREEFQYVLQIGITRFVQIALKSRPSFDAPVVTFVRDEVSSKNIMTMLSVLGMIEHGRRMAQLISSGTGNIQQVNASEFLITLPDNIIDEAYYEKMAAAHYSRETGEFYEHLFKHLFTEEIKGEVGDALTDLVYPWREHFIGYGATPILDEYFFSIAYANLQMYDGFDSFNGTVMFGGIEYRNYLLALTFIVSIFSRHEKFAEALIRKNPEIKLENVLTITSDTPEFLDSLVDALNEFGMALTGFKKVNLEQAKIIFEVLSVSRKNLSLLDSPGCAMPSLIQSSDQGFIRCLSGAQVSPVKFLLDSLRHHFSRDYDRNQQSREKSMQIGVERVLNEAISNLIYRENVKIKIGTQLLTDVDKVVIEERSGIIFLCQLKYQELFGSDLHAKHERTNRLKEQIAHWFSAMKHWIESVDDAAIRATLRLPKTMKKIDLRLVVISKHYAYPLLDLPDTTDIAFTNWIQFCNTVALVKRDEAESSNLQHVFNKILEMVAPAGPQIFEQEPSRKWIVGDLQFTIRHQLSNA
jgi:hypothetical protein